MQALAEQVVSSSPFKAPRPRPRTALIASSDRSFRRRLNEILTGLRWQVREAAGGAEVWSEADDEMPEAVIVDSWLPDLDLNEFLSEFRQIFPDVDVITTGDTVALESPRGPHRQELLYALRGVQEADTAAWRAAPSLSDCEPQTASSLPEAETVLPHLVPKPQPSFRNVAAMPAVLNSLPSQAPANLRAAVERLPQLIGNAPCMLEISRRIRLVASRNTPVLIEGPTGSGKEVVAEALHRLSSRNRKPMVAINCAAIPEALLEAELFGHTRGAFTGAVQGREGRLEAADGGTLFLDEIGEIPLALQAKLLRFVESGELQRVGDNENVKVDVRVLAATHCPLAQLAQSGAFRADLYYRLAVFLVHTPALADHMQDVPLLVEHFLDKMARQDPRKSISDEAIAKLMAHPWPGNVRELEHVLERAAILAGDEPLLTAREIDFGYAIN